MTRHHALNWFELPVRDMNRAQAFYEAILGAPLRREQMPAPKEGAAAHTLAVFPCDATCVGGCLMAGTDVAPPSSEGTLVYLNAHPSLDAVLARVNAAGGRITLPRVDLPGDMGCFAHMIDTEGNRVGLHALA